ncbi:hypothetical protein PMG11_06017 [Penicillium brasilianum]|uniref:NADH:flavin oxidoreductase/NADH oxidase N-terminal domain-containing protein n=1 Tax=Penicillium brasilianum TaxID=104259 RepID=A0A0F7TPG6_PENBI|nr:hypothetical protein PMG11_06017 [Penicillium brasilianum]
MADQCSPSTEGEVLGRERANSVPTVVRIREYRKTDNPLKNTPAPHTPYYTPVQRIPAGTAIVPPESEANLPKLFQPLQLRGLTLQNRIIVSPMCQYSAENGHLTDWHLAHLGGILQRGPGLTIVEATAVTPEGRITPEDSGLWQDSQIEPLKRIVDFAHGQCQHIAIQLGHAGRKASTVAPWIDRKAAAPAEGGGWPELVLGTSDLPFDAHTCVPRTMTLKDISEFKQSFLDAVHRAVKAGFDAIEIHAAHGYLLHSSLSAATNNLPNPYSGSLENRMRLLLELVTTTRSAIPSSMPLLVRIPGSDWMGHDPSVPSWDIEQCVQLSLELSKPKYGVDLLDVLSAGLMAEQKIVSGPGYQAPFSEAVKNAIHGSKTLVGVVGLLNTGTHAEELLQKQTADVVVVGRGFLRNPGLVWQWAEELGIESRLAGQIGWGFGQKAARGVLMGTKGLSARG